MGRPKRISRPGLIHHVINRGNNKQQIFFDDEDYNRYLRTVIKYKMKYDFNLFAFCLMRNHVHLLIKTDKKASISKIMHSITTQYSQWHNEKYNKIGHLWQGRFLSPIVSDDQYLINVMRYIEQNPVRANIVQTPHQYGFSSYQFNIADYDCKIIDRRQNPLFEYFGGNRADFIKNHIKLVNNIISSAEIISLKKGFDKGFYGSESFKKENIDLFPSKKKSQKKSKKVSDTKLMVPDMDKL